MTRKFLQDIRGQIASTLPDNTQGLITPVNHRALLTDFLDSITEVYAELIDQTVQVDFPVPTTFTPITNYDQAIGGATGLLELNQVNGTISSGPTAGYNYIIIAQIQFEADNNAGFEVGVAAGGTVVSFVRGITGRGPNNAVSGTVVVDVVGGAANTPVDLRIRNVDGGTENITINQVSLVSKLLPTESPGP